MANLPTVARVPGLGDRRLERFTEQVAHQLNALTRSLQLELAGQSDYTINPGGLGLGSLADPNADRILFWDDSVGSLNWLALGGTVSITGTTLSVTTAAVSTITNNVTSGGVNDTIADYTDLVTYATDAAAIRNNIYQLARKQKLIIDALRTIGIFT